MDMILFFAQLSFAAFSAGAFFAFVFSGPLGQIFIAFVFGAFAYWSFSIDAWWPLFLSIPIIWLYHGMKI